MRFLRPLTTLLCLAWVVSLCSAADVSFVRVWPGWADAESFDSISEYFTGREHTGKRVVLRTRPESRAGFYFLVRVANAGAEASAKFSLQVIMPGNPEPRTYPFPVQLAPRSSVYQLGLTGADWPGRDVYPVAWKLDLLSDDDQVLATTQSFLWSKPAK